MFRGIRKTSGGPPSSNAEWPMEVALLMGLGYFQDDRPQDTTEREVIERIRELLEVAVAYRLIS
jgi:hypothetical protein